RATPPGGRNGRASGAAPGPPAPAPPRPRARPSGIAPGEPVLPAVLGGIQTLPVAEHPVPAVALLADRRHQVCLHQLRHLDVVRNPDFLSADADDPTLRIDPSNPSSQDADHDPPLSASPESMRCRTV